MARTLRLLVLGPGGVERVSVWASQARPCPRPRSGRAPPCDVEAGGVPAPCRRRRCGCRRPSSSDAAGPDHVPGSAGTSHVGVVLAELGVGLYPGHPSVEDELRVLVAARVVILGRRRPIVQHLEAEPLVARRVGEDGGLVVRHPVERLRALRRRVVSDPFQLLVAPPANARPRPTGASGRTRSAGSRLVPRSTAPFGDAGSSAGAWLSAYAAIGFLVARVVVAASRCARPSRRRAAPKPPTRVVPGDQVVRQDP